MRTIGLPGYKNADNASFGVGVSYLQWASQFGNPRIIMPWEEFVDVDLLILPGGLVLNPAAYGEIPGFRTTNQDVFKQFFYDKRLETYIQTRTPIFGICLGHQQLAARFGSKITQDLIYHPYSNPRTELAHEVIIYDNGQLRIKNNKPATTKVNSLHHQAIYQHNLGEDLQIMLGCKEAGKIIVEAFRHRELPIMGYQAHPEETNCVYAKSMVELLLEEVEINQ